MFINLPSTLSRKACFRRKHENSTRGEAMTEIIIKEHYVADGTVEEFLTALASATGELIEWEKRYVVTTSSMRVAVALDSLFGANGSVMAPEKKEPEKNTPVVYPTRQASTLKEIKAWEVFENGQSVEKITVTDKNIRLVARQFKAGTVLHHPKGGWQRVTGELGSAQGMEPLTAEQVREMGLA
jgi:type III secretory pathway component EscU